MEFNAVLILSNARRSRETRATGNGAVVDGGGIASDGNINLINSDVYGDARPGIGKNITFGPNARVTGWMADLEVKLTDLYNTKGDAWVPPAVNNNAWITPQTALSGSKFAPAGNIAVNFPANGRYYFKSTGNSNAWTGNGGITTINAPADIYVDGTFKSGQGSLLVQDPPEPVSHFAVPDSSHTFQVRPAPSSWWNRLSTSSRHA